MMAPLALYAVTATAPRLPLGAGATREPLRWIDCGGLGVVAGETGAVPPLERAVLQRHDDTVRRIADGVEALLPARFGQIVADEEALAGHVESLRPRLLEALDLVAGRTQMTLRIFTSRQSDDSGQGERASGEAVGPNEGRTVDEAELRADPASAARQSGDDAAGLDPAIAQGAGPGAAYLARRRKLLSAQQSLPEIAPLQEELRPLVRAERLRRHDRGTLLGTVHHLVEKADPPRYVALCEGATLSGIRIGVSGPWPPYAFAPGGLR